MDECGCGWIWLDVSVLKAVIMLIVSFKRLKTCFNKTTSFSNLVFLGRSVYLHEF